VDGNLIKMTSCALQLGKQYLHGMSSLAVFIWRSQSVGKTAASDVKCCCVAAAAEPVLYVPMPPILIRKFCRGRRVGGRVLPSDEKKIAEPTEHAPLPSK
jgi:hypothetical protein